MLKCSNWKVTRRLRCVNLREKLLGAASDGNVAACERLLSDGSVRVDAESNESQELGWSALLSAARRGHAELVKLLLDHGADVNALSSSLQTP